MVMEYCACNRLFCAYNRLFCTYNGLFCTYNGLFCACNRVAVGLFRGRGCERSELPCLARSGDF